MIDVEVSEEHLESDMRKILEQAYPEWLAKYGNDQIKTSPMNGGISNKLYACYPNSIGLNSHETLLFRLYGKDTEKFVDREEEIATLSIINSIGLGPRFYTSFRNGICYEYLPGRIADYELVTNPDVYPKIAESVATLHLASFKGLRTEEQLEPDEKPFIFEKIRQVIDLIREDYTANIPKMTDVYLKKTPTIRQLRDELSYMEARVKE